MYDLWKNATNLTRRFYSRGEKDTNIFLKGEESMKTKHAKSRLGKVRNTMKMNDLFKD